jgi:hypothetical protein
VAPSYSKTPSLLCALLANDAGDSYITDGPNSDIYNFAPSFKAHFSNPGASLNLKYADPQAILCLGLNLQFSEKCKYFQWGTGAVNLKGRDGMPDYSPYHPRQNQPAGQPSRRDLSPVYTRGGAMDTRERQPVVGSADLGFGRQAFFA